MNTSGEVADQIVRISLEVGETALKISGNGAKELAVLLYAVMKDQKKTRGKTRMETMLRSGKPLTVFAVQNTELKKFVKEAKRYGIQYCAVQKVINNKSGVTDILVKTEDAARINRIVERFQLASVQKAKVQIEEEKVKEPTNPAWAKTGKSPRSVPISEKPENARGSFKSVRKELKEIISKKETTEEIKRKAKEAIRSLVR